MCFNVVGFMYRLCFFKQKTAYEMRISDGSSDVCSSDLEQQVKRLEKIRRERDQKAVEAALTDLTKAAEDGGGNLLDLAVKATRVRATVGEISDALEKIYTRHRAVIRSVTGIYGSAYEGDEGFRRIQGEVEAFEREEGRRPRMLVVKLGQDELQ